MMEASYLLYDTDFLETRSANELATLAHAHVSVSEASTNDYQDGDRNVLRNQLLRMVVMASTQSCYAQEIGAHQEAQDYWDAQTKITSSIRAFDLL